MTNFRKNFLWFNNHPQTIYFDNAATALKPIWLKEELANFNSFMSDSKFQTIIDKTAKSLAQFLNAQPTDVYFTHGATVAINFIAEFLGHQLDKDDQILLNFQEHNANLIPWIKLEQTKKVQIKYCNNLDDELSIDDFLLFLTPKTKVVSIANQTNLIGNCIDANLLAQKIKDKNPNCVVIIDATQFFQHSMIDLQATKIDFLFASAHKMYGPNGVGFFYANATHQKQIKLWNDQDWFINIDQVLKKQANFKNFDLSAIQSFNQSLIFRNEFQEEIEQLEQNLISYFEKHFPYASGFNIIPRKKQSTIFLIYKNNIPAEDLSYYLASKNIIVRSGNCCVGLIDKVLQPLNFIRVSLSFLNTFSEIDFLFQQLSNFSEQDLINFIK